MSDDNIRERHGVKAVKNEDSREEILVCEGEQYVVVRLGHAKAWLSPGQARYLAAKMYRLARRIKQRTEKE